MALAREVRTKGKSIVRSLVMLTSLWHSPSSTTRGTRPCNSRSNACECLVEKPDCAIVVAKEALTSAAGSDR